MIDKARVVAHSPLEYLVLIWYASALHHIYTSFALGNQAHELANSRSTTESLRNVQ